MIASKIQIVADTGPLISLEKLGNGYPLIRQLYDALIVPDAVLTEVAQGQFSNPQDYLRHYDIVGLVDVRTVSISHPVLQENRLDLGESQAIQLALDLKLPLLIEETIGRGIAQSLGLSISGIAGQIIKAHRLGLVTRENAITMLTQLFQSGRINRKIYLALLTAINSEPL